MSIGSATHIGTAQAILRAAMRQIGEHGDVSGCPTLRADVQVWMTRALDNLAHVDISDCERWLNEERCQRPHCGSPVAAVVDGEGWCEAHRP